MRMHKMTSVLGAALLALPWVGLAGCDREISHSENVDIRDDGSVRTKEKTVKQDSDGNIIKEETSTRRDDDGDTKTTEKTTVESPGGTVIEKKETKSSTDVLD